MVVYVEEAGGFVTEAPSSSSMPYLEVKVTPIPPCSQGNVLRGQV